MNAILFVEIYLGCGLAFAFWFMLKGAAEQDESAQGISWKVKLLWFPGVVALWPLLWWRSHHQAKLGGPNPAPARHRRIWLLLSIALPALYFLAIAVLPKEHFGEPIEAALSAALPMVIKTIDSGHFLLNIRRDTSGARQVEIFIKSPLETPAADLRLNGVFIGTMSIRGLYRFPVRDTTGGILQVFDPIHRVDIANFSLN